MVGGLPPELKENILKMVNKEMLKEKKRMGWKDVYEEMVHEIFDYKPYCEFENCYTKLVVHRDGCICIACMLNRNKTHIVCTVNKAIYEFDFKWLTSKDQRYNFYYSPYIATLKNNPRDWPKVNKKGFNPEKRTFVYFKGELKSWYEVKKFLKV